MVVESEGCHGIYSSEAFVQHTADKQSVYSDVISQPTALCPGLPMLALSCPPPSRQLCDAPHMSEHQRVMKPEGRRESIGGRNRKVEEANGG